MAAGFRTVENKFSHPGTEKEKDAGGENAQHQTVMQCGLDGAADPCSAAAGLILSHAWQQYDRHGIGDGGGKEKHGHGHARDCAVKGEGISSGQPEARSMPGIRMASVLCRTVTMT